MAAPELRVISSMATRVLLNELVQQYEKDTGKAVVLESVGGVNALQRVLDGEAFDVVVLAADAIEKVLASGRALAGSRVDLVRSSVAVAVPAGAPRPDISTEAALRAAVLAAPLVGYSTGPSGTALTALFARWQIASALQGRLVQAPAGVPVAQWLAEQRLALGFQQLSELMGAPGVDVIGSMPEGTEINTVFSAAVCTAATQVVAARELLAGLSSPATAALKRRCGMEPP
jgi:molybdate transport system substrate-binding protein